MEITQTDSVLTVFLDGELDHHAAPALREQTDLALVRRRPGLLVLDFTRVTFMDSSAVGFVLGRSKKAAAFGCKTAVRGLDARSERMMRLSGVPAVADFIKEGEIGA